MSGEFNHATEEGFDDKPERAIKDDPEDALKDDDESVEGVDGDDFEVALDGDELEDELDEDNDTEEAVAGNAEGVEHFDCDDLEEALDNDQPKVEPDDKDEISDDEDDTETEVEFDEGDDSSEEAFEDDDDTESVMKVLEVDDLKDVLRLMDEQKDANPLIKLTLDIESGTNCSPHSDKASDWLWQILSHPHSKITKLAVLGSSFQVLGRLEVAKCLRRWCMEIPPTLGPRELSLLLILDAHECTGAMLDELRKALTCPNNGIEELKVLGASSLLRLCASVLRSVLQHPNNMLRVLELNHIHIINPVTNNGMAHGSLSKLHEISPLTEGLASPNCKLKCFSMENSALTSSGPHALLDGLAIATPTLEQIILWNLPVVFSDNGIMHKLTVLLCRPGNRIRLLKVKVKPWSQDHISMLAEAIGNEHCQLEELVLHDGNFCDDLFLPLAIALRHPNNRIKTLTAAFRGRASAAALAESLRNSNCRLESLSLGSRKEQPDYEVAIAVADALRLSMPSRLRGLQIHISACTTEVHSAYASSLRSPNNRLTHLHIKCDLLLDKETYYRFCRAVRTSSLHKIDFIWTWAHVNRFSDLFNEPFVQVLYTLLSFGRVPRLLVKNAWLKRLPFHDLIFQIAETLDWPLEDLYMPPLRKPTML